jgi:hypothetical protein
MEKVEKVKIKMKKLAAVRVATERVNIFEENTLFLIFLPIRLGVYSLSLNLRPRSRRYVFV